jgi:signal transduction histidine kinase
VRGIRISVYAVAAVSAAVTVAVALFPTIDPASSALSLRVAICTAPSLIALAAGFLVLGRFRRRGCLNDLVLACSLGTLALSGLAFVTVPLVLQRFWPDLWVWAALAGGALGAVLLALAAFVPRRRLRRPGIALAASAAAVTATLLLIAVLAEASAARLPVMPAATTGYDPPVRPDLDIAAVLPAVEVAVAAIYGLAATGFLRRSGRFHDEYFGWLAVSAVLAAIAHVDYFLFPALYLHFVSLGDVFLLCFCVVLLGGSVRDNLSYWRAAPEAAVLAERRRIARDLHDGPVQELAYLMRNIDSLNGTVDKETKAHLRSAAERAELDIRLAIDAIAAPRSQSVNTAIAQATGEVAARDHIKLELDVIPGIQLPAPRADALVRIACEAVSNAARHSGAAQVSLSLQRQGKGVRLRVSDNGDGFDPRFRVDGFGLTSMRDRAASVGGDLRISSVPGRGTEVEVQL